MSVIIPVKNGGRFLASAIRSVLEQDYKDLEIIVIDGKSKDDTERIAKSFQNVRYVLQTDDGFGSALNTGIDLSKGELIAFMSCDDLWESNKLSLQVDYLLKHPDVQYTIAKVKFFLEEGSTIPPGFRKGLLVGCHNGYMPEALLVRKSVFDLIGKFDAGVKVSADVDWFAMAKDRHIPMAIIPEILLHKRVHHASTTLAPLQVRTINHELLRCLKKSIDRQKKDGS